MSTTETLCVGEEILPGYRLEKFLGRGGFGEVWKGSGPGGIPLALKIIHDLDRRRGGKELRALQLLKNIRHPNLVPVTAFWLLDQNRCPVPMEPEPHPDSPHANSPHSNPLRGTLATQTSYPPPSHTTSEPVSLVIAMGLAECSLFDLVLNNQVQGIPGVPADELGQYIEDAARGIDLLNTRHGIQHCDVKPQNILLVSGAAQVADFGLATAIGDVRKSSMGAGTIAYGAPEILLGSGPSQATDQYSLAISYVELRTGRLPYESEQISDVLRAKNCGLIQVDQLNPAERDIILKATQLDPAQRFSCCQELARELRRAAGGVSPGLAAIIDTRRDWVRTTPSETSPVTEPSRSWYSRNSGSIFTTLGIAAAASFLIFQFGNFRAHQGGLQCAAIFPFGPEAPNAHAGHRQDARHSDDLAREHIRELVSELVREVESAQHQHHAPATSPPATNEFTPASEHANHDSGASRQTPENDTPSSTSELTSLAAATAESTRSIANDTKKITEILELLRNDLANAASKGGIVDSPTTAADFYHNARLYEQRGEYLNARKSFESFFEFGLDVVDAFSHYAQLLKMHEGIAGAQQHVRSIADRMGHDAAQLTLRLLEPDESRLEQLQDFVQKRPDFAPAVYHLSCEYSQEHLGAQTLCDKAKEKELLARFHDLVDNGLLHQHFVDQSAASRMLDDARQRRDALVAIDDHVLKNPVSLQAHQSGNTWSITISIAEPAREISYRVGEDSKFVTTGTHSGIRDQRTGSPLPKMSFELSLKAVATTIFVKYQDLRGIEQGPFELPFDPLTFAISSAKARLEMSPNSWAAFREFDGTRMVYFSHLISHRVCLSEIRYGVGCDVLNHVFPLPASDPTAPNAIGPNDQVYITVPNDVEFITVQLAFKDGTESVLQRIER